MIYVLNVFDLQTTDQLEGIDLTPGSDTEEEHDSDNKIRRRLLEMARESDKLKGDADPKLKKAAGLIKDLLSEKCQQLLRALYYRDRSYCTKY